jgi:hypothetical protein
LSDLKELTVKNCAAQLEKSTGELRQVILGFVDTAFNDVAKTSGWTELSAANVLDILKRPTLLADVRLENIAQNEIYSLSLTGDNCVRGRGRLGKGCQCHLVYVRAFFM